MPRLQHVFHPVPQVIRQLDFFVPDIDGHAPAMREGLLFIPKQRALSSENMNGLNNERAVANDI